MKDECKLMVSVKRIPRREEEAGAQKNLKNNELHLCCSYEILLGCVVFINVKRNTCRILSG
jgi:hypothetical protein